MISQSLKKLKKSKENIELEALSLRLSALKMKDSLTSINPGDRLAPGVFLLQDPRSKRKIEITSPKDKVVHIRASEHQQTSWTTLHFQLETLDMPQVDLLGLMVKAQSFTEQAQTIPVAIRNGTRSGFRDAFFPKQIVLTDSMGRHVDMADPAELQGLPQMAEWRELILFLPAYDIDFCITKMSFIVQ